MPRTPGQELAYCNELFKILSTDKLCGILHRHDLAQIIKTLRPRNVVKYSFIASEEHLRLLSDPFDDYWKEGNRIKQLARFALFYDSEDLLAILLALGVKVNWTKYFVRFVSEGDDVYSSALLIFCLYPLSPKTLGVLLIWKTYINKLPFAFASVPTDYFMQVEEFNMTEQVVSAMIVAGIQPDVKLLWRLIISNYSSRRAIRLLAKHIDHTLFDQPVVEWKDSNSHCYAFPCTVMELAELRGMKYLLSKEVRKQYFREIAIDYRCELRDYFKKTGVASDGLVEATWPLDRNLAASMMPGGAKSKFRLEKENIHDAPARWWPHRRVHAKTWNYRYTSVAGSGWNASTCSQYWKYL
jgi:hypothetical protein